jgi:predicted nucleotidyltransferase
MRLTPLQALKKTVAALSELPCRFCLVGGHAASLYRSQERFTRDVDFALVADAKGKSRAIASQAIEKLGMKPVAGFMVLGDTEKSQRAVCMVTSEPLPSELTGLVDILLPELPWVLDAVGRAQDNLIDLGFAKVPVITAEDLILAKCYAVRNSPDRFQDLDDLKQLFKDVKDLDTDYVRRRLVELELTIPEHIKQFAPDVLR